MLFRSGATTVDRRVPPPPAARTRGGRRGVGTRRRAASPCQGGGAGAVSASCRPGQAAAVSTPALLSGGGWFWHTPPRGRGQGPGGGPSFSPPTRGAYSLHGPPGPPQRGAQGRAPAAGRGAGRGWGVAPALVPAARGGGAESWRAGPREGRVRRGVPGPWPPVGGYGETSCPCRRGGVPPYVGGRVVRPRCPRESPGVRGEGRRTAARSPYSAPR